MKKTKVTKSELALRLGVSRSSLYYKQKKPVADDEQKLVIMAVMDQHKAYGQRRVAWALGWNPKRTKRLMNKYGLRPQVRRGFVFVKPDDVGRPDTRVQNILKQICPIAPNVVWAGDFTYIWFIDHFWYVATVIDVYTREVLGWHIANHHTTSLIIEAFKDAVRKTAQAPDYFHSDQGSEYVAGAYESLLTGYGTTISHSQKGSPWQNGFQESFYSQFKLELGSPKQYANIGQLIEAVHRQIYYYNNERIHSAHRTSPVSFRKQKMLQMSTLNHLLLQPLKTGKTV